MFSILETIVKIATRSRLVDGSKDEVASGQTELAPGESWKHLIIRDLLGKGHFGAVYRAYDSRLGREVALKFLKSSAAMQEARLLARIHHDGVVQVHSLEEEGGLAAICMELVDGVDLETYLASKGRLDVMHVGVIGRRVARALAAVHRAGLLHRDIKAQNVILARDARIVLVDFGLGVPIDSPMNDFAGTLPYMAPEQFEGAPAGRSTDSYALGVLLFHLVCGEYPIVADSVTAFQRLHRSGARLHLADCVSVPEPFERLVERAISARPADRFPSAGALAAALDQVAHDGGLRTWQGARKKALWAAAALAAGAAVSFGAVALGNRLAKRPEPALERLESAIGVYDEPSLSADGRILVFSSDKAGHGDLDIWVKYVNSGSSKPLTGAGADESEPAISADGTQVAYRSERGGGGIYINSTLGGDERRIARFGRHPRFSPDGRFLAYWIGEEGDAQTASARTYVVAVPDGQPVPILADFADCRFPAWSPDGRQLLVTASRDRVTSSDASRDWWLVPIGGGGPRKLDFYQRLRARKLRPLEYPPNWAGKHVVFGAVEGDAVETAAIWQVSLTGERILDQPKPLTSGITREANPWTLDDGTVAFVARSPRVNIWSLPLQSRQPELTRETSTLNFDWMPHVAGDGSRLVFSRSVGPDLKPWLRERASGTERQLPLPEAAESFIIGSDGGRIAYNPSRLRDSLIEYVVESGVSRTLCVNCGSPLNWSSDGSHILYRESSGSKLALLDLSSGVSSPLPTDPARSYSGAAISPNGSLVAAVERVDSEHSSIAVARLRNWTMPAGEQWSRLTSDKDLNIKAAWSADSRMLYYYSNRDGFGCIWAQRVDGNGKPWGAPEPVLHLHSARLGASNIERASLNLAVGGGRLFLNLDEVTSALWLRRPQGTKSPVHGQFPN